MELFDNTLGDLTEWLSARSPAAAKVVEKLQAGEIGEVEAMQVLMDVVSKEGLGPAFEKAAKDMFNDLPNPPAAPSQDVQYELTDTKAEAPGELWQPKEGVLARNPILEAAIAERAQFDGDVPEFRRGSLKEGMTPAVPVNTNTMNPVALGAELEAASQDVHAEIKAVEGERIKYLGSVSDKASQGDEAALTLLTEHLPQPVTGVDRYKAGKIPQPIAVPEATGSTLLALSQEDRKRHAFKSYSTTQGRRSALSPLETAVQKALAEKGVEVGVVSQGQYDDPETMVSAAWTMQLGFEGSTQPNFSYLGTAARALANRLARAVGDHGLPSNPVLQLATVDAIAERVVGWKARIISESQV